MYGTLSCLRGMVGYISFQLTDSSVWRRLWNSVTPVFFVLADCWILQKIFYHSRQGQRLLSKASRHVLVLTSLTTYLLGVEVFPRG